MNEYPAVWAEESNTCSLKAPVVSYEQSSYVFNRKVTIEDIHPITQFIITSFTISPELPAGLSFDSETGIISGTPEVYYPAANFTIIASNEEKSSSVMIEITVLNKICDAANEWPETVSGNTSILPCENAELFSGSITRECIDADNSYLSTEVYTCTLNKCA